MNKNFVHQVGDQTKVILRCTVNQPSRLRKTVGSVNIDHIWRIRNNMGIDKLIEGGDIVRFINLLKPTGNVMHHQQFNIQRLYALTTLYLCVLYLSENKQRLVPLTA